jgi:hypothetical protein
MAEKYKPVLINPENDSCYFDKLRDGYRLVAEFRSLLASAEKVPMYYARGYDSEGEPYGIHENLEPWDAAEEAAQDIAKHPGPPAANVRKFTVRLPDGGDDLYAPDSSSVSSGPPCSWWAPWCSTVACRAKYVPLGMT